MVAALAVLAVLVGIGSVALLTSDDASEAAGLSLPPDALQALMIEAADVLIEDTTIVYVVREIADGWSAWCPAEPDWPSDLEAACQVLSQMDEQPHRLSRSDLDLIEATLERFEVRVAGRSADAYVESEAIPAPVIDDAGVLVFGLPVEAGGVIYIPVDGYGTGAIFELRQTTEGWEVDPGHFWTS